MDEHGSKAAYIGGGLIIALVIIGIVFGIFQVASGMSRTGTSKLTKMSGTLQDSTFTQYDGATVNGDQILALIKEHEADEISIVVNNGHAEKQYIFTSSGASDAGAATIGTAVPKADMATLLHDAATKTKADTYIAPTKQFLCTICKDTGNDAIVAMYFKPAP